MGGGCVFWVLLCFLVDWGSVSKFREMGVLGEKAEEAKNRKNVMFGTRGVSLCGAGGYGIMRCGGIDEVWVRGGVRIARQCLGGWDISLTPHCYHLRQLGNGSRMKRGN